MDSRSPTLPPTANSQPILPIPPPPILTADLQPISPTPPPILTADSQPISPTPPLTMALPPLAVYQSKQALFEAIQAWAKPRGYAFTTSKSKRIGEGRQKVYFACDRYKPVRIEAPRIRKTQSRTTGCPFSILAVELGEQQGWELKHRPEYKFSTHNHAPSPSPSAHPSHRQMPAQDQAITSGIA
jgi:hypothetical protein